MTSGNGERRDATEEPARDLWVEADAVFAAALALEEPARQEYVRRRCGTDAVLLSRVLRLLQSAASVTPLDQAGEALAGTVEEVFGGAAARPGDHVGAYVLTRLLGRGGSGSVYLAYRADGAFEQQVAVKILRHDLDGAGSLARFQAERQILASLEHPGIARLIDGGATASGRPFTVMEYVDGESITEHCDARRCTVRERLRLFVQVTRSVAYAHSRLVVHRDIKPGNILVTATGEPKLLDFGIARLLEADGADLTRTGAVLLTPAFASPEQLRGERVSTATDVYQLGMLLHLLLTGRLPFAGDGSRADRRAAGAEPQPPSRRVTLVDAADAESDPVALARLRGTEPARLARDLRGDLDTIITKCLRAEPERRYASAAELADDVERHLGRHPIRARPPSLGYRARRFAARRPGVLATAVAAVLAAVVYGGTLRAHAERLEVERDRAVAEERRAEAVSRFLVGLFGDPGEATARPDTLSARALLDIGARRIADELHDDPPTRAALLFSVGSAYDGIGAGGPALELLEASYSLHSELYGGSDNRTLAVLERLADARRGARHDSRARELFAVLIDERRAAGRGSTNELARALRSLSMLLRDTGHPDSALATFDEALALRGALPGDSLAAHARDIGLRGFLLRAAGATDSAAAQYRQALELLAGREEEHAPAAIPLFTNYGFLLRRQLSDPDAAEPMYRRALELQRQLEGELAPRTQQLMVHHALVLEDLGRHDEAEALHRARIDAATRAWGAESFQAGDALGEFGAYLLGRGDLADAERAFRDSGRIYAAALGPEHSYVGRAKLWIGKALAARSAFAAAEVELLAALELLRASTHDNARRLEPEVGAALTELYAAWGRAAPVAASFDSPSISQ